MEITEIKQQIKTGEFNPIYIFHGEEWAILKIYLKMMAEKSNKELTYVDSILDILSGIKTKSLVPVHHLYVIIGDKEFLTNDKMWDKFKGLKDDIVVFYYPTTDKRLKFWKRFSDTAVEFKKLDNRVLTKYIKKEIPLSDENCEELINICENDYGRILLEADKIKNYLMAIESKQPNKTRYDQSFEHLVKCGVIYRPSYDAIFDFVGAVLERNPSKAYHLLENSKAVGEANLTLLSVMYNNIKTLLQIQSAKDYKTLGLNGWVVKNTIKYKGNYSNGELVRAMKCIRYAERGIKTGDMPDAISVDYVLANIL